MEIHGSSLNISVLKPGLKSVGKLEAAPQQPENEPSTFEHRQKSSEPIAETPAGVEKILADAGLFQLTTAFEPNNQTVDLRRQNAINAYTRQITLPMLEQRSQLLAGIDLYV